MLFVAHLVSESANGLRSGLSIRNTARCCDDASSGRPRWSGTAASVESFVRFAPLPRSVAKHCKRNKSSEEAETASNKQSAKSFVVKSVGQPLGQRVALLAQSPPVRCREKQLRRRNRVCVETVSLRPLPTPVALSTVVHLV